MPGVASVELKFAPLGPQFAISEDCVMPTISATAKISNPPPGFKGRPTYSWKATLIFDGANCPHARGRVISHPPISQRSESNTFNIKFAQVRGGNLVISVSVQMGKDTVTATSKGLQVVGTNPSIGKLISTVPHNETFRRMMRLESQLKQFLSPTCPLFNKSNDGGAGICQVTPPSDEEVWNWKLNVAAGYRIYLEKERIARHYPARVRKFPGFVALVKAFNDQRLKAGAAANPAAPASNSSLPAPATTAASHPAALKPLVIELPDFTPEQLQRDVIRGYNGWAGRYMGHELHEFRVKVDRNGILVVTEDGSGSRGKAEWEQVPPEDRPMNGDYVDLVLNRYAPF